MIVGVVLLCAVPVKAAQFQRDKLLGDCAPLAECLQILDAAPKGSFGSISGDEDGIATSLLRFGEPTKQALLARAIGPDRAWRNLAGGIHTGRHFPPPMFRRCGRRFAWSRVDGLPGP